PFRIRADLNCTMTQGQGPASELSPVSHSSTSPYREPPAIEAAAMPYIVRPMGCLVALLALISPRLALAAIWLFSDLLSRAFDSWVLPLLGFFLLPWTTLGYAVMWSIGSNRVSGFEWFIVVLAFLADLGSYANGQRARAYKKE